jgi:O-antigen/teichoic acid export membrane protein
MLGPEDFAIVAVITSLIAIFGIPSYAIQTVISKNTTLLNVNKKISKIKGLMKSSLKRTLALALIFFVIYSLFATKLAIWLNINYIYLFLTGIYIFGSFIYPVMTGIAQGMKRFSDFGFNFLINCMIKFIIGIGLIYLGFKVYGAIAGFLAGIFLAFLLFFYNLRDILKNKTKSYEIQIFSKDNLYSLMAMVIFVLLFNLDVIFAKALFSPEVTGKYAVASLIGKMVLFVISSIGTVMLPVSSEKHLAGGDTKGVLKKTLGLSFVICLVAILFLIFFPEFIIKILFGQQYIDISGIMIYIGLAFCFLAFLNIYLLQAIATNKLRKENILIMLICLLIEIALFLIFSKNIYQYSLAFMISCFITFSINYIALRRK